MFSYRLEDFFRWLPQQGIRALFILLGICVLAALVLFILSEYKKRNARQRKIYTGAAAFFLLTGIYGVFYIVKILYAQELLAVLFP